MDEYLDKGEEGLPARLPDEPLDPVEASDEYFDAVVKTYLGKTSNFDEE